MKSAVKEVFDTRKNLKTSRWFKPALTCHICRQLLFYSLGVNKTIFRDRKNARVAPKTQWKGKTWVSGLPNWAKGEEIQASQRQTTEKSSILSEGGTPLQKPLCAAAWGRLFFLFGLKRGKHFAHFGLESGLVFEGTTECMNVFIVSIPNE